MDAMSEPVHHSVVPEFICEYHHLLGDAEGRRYSARLYGIAQGEGIWDGWLVFFPVEGGPLRRTDVEVEQRSRADLSRWGAAVTPPYLAEALRRSHPFWETGVSPEEAAASP